MKTAIQFFVSHTATAAITIAAMLGCGAMDATSRWSIVAIVAIASAAGISFLLSARASRGLSLLRSIASGADVSKQSLSGVSEYDEIAREWIASSSSKEEIEANYGRMTRELASILQRLDAASGQPSASQLRSVLVNIGGNMHSSIAQLQQKLHDLGRGRDEIESSTSAAAATTSKAYVQQLADSLADSRTQSKSTEQSIDAGADAAREAVQVTVQLADSLARIQAATDTNIRQIRSLSDPTRQISSMVDTIGDVAARTNMLALNASIESIRAGEHGRGFAVVADEIRKLAEQTSQAAREIGVLTETLISQTTDSVAVISSERSKIGDDAELVGAIEKRLIEIMECATENSGRFQNMTRGTQRQQELLDSINSSIEQAINASESGRKQTERIQWAVQSIGQVTAELQGSVRSLRRCSNNFVEDTPFDLTSESTLDADHATQAVESESVVNS